MTVYVISTMTNSVSYRFYRNVESKGGTLPVVQDSITIRGGAGLPSLKSGFGDMNSDGEGHPIWTAEGMVTPLSEARYDILKTHKLFQDHLEGGYVKVVNKDLTGNHAAVKKEIGGMAGRDNFAQLTPATASNKIKVKTRLELEPDAQFRI